MSKITQQAKILAYCQEHGSITVREAFTKLDINSPCKRISEMRHSGKDIVTSTEETKIEDGKVVGRWLRYFIKAVEQ